MSTWRFFMKENKLEKFKSLISLSDDLVFDYSFTEDIVPKLPYPLNVCSEGSFQAIYFSVCQMAAGICLNDGYTKSELYKIIDDFAEEYQGLMVNEDVEAELTFLEAVRCKISEFDM